jgi:hypothetical protein
VVLNRRLSLCFPARVETYQREHPELALPSLSRLNGKTWQHHAPKKSSMSPPRYTAMQFVSTT